MFVCLNVTWHLIFYSRLVNTWNVHSTIWVSKLKFEINLNLEKSERINTFFLVQQRFVLAGMLFLSLGVAFAFNMSFSLILTQMVYVPNSFMNFSVNTNSETFDSNSEEICPIRYTENQNQNDITNLVRTNSTTTKNPSSKKFIVCEFKFRSKRTALIQIDFNGHKSYKDSFCRHTTLVIFYLKFLVEFWPTNMVQKPFCWLAPSCLHFLRAQYHWQLTTVSEFTVWVVNINIKIAFIQCGILATGDSTGLIIVRVLIGLSQGIIPPSIASFAVQWFPVEELGRTCSIVYMGINVWIFLRSFCKITFVPCLILS